MFISHSQDRQHCFHTPIDNAMSIYLVVSLLAWHLSIWVPSDAASLRDDRPIVDVPGQGRVVGVEEETITHFAYYAFRAIPYAVPPVGQLRFKDPIESTGWQGDLDGSTLPSACTQKEFLLPNGDEDCLYLSVYTPTDALDANRDPLAVMVYIHGGFLQFGSMKEYDGCHPIVRKDVIVVTLQYRLGILGFLSTEDSVAPGNLGLKDQTLALTWVKNYISSFGGDPEKITVFGESAGSYSLHYQILSPSAAGLFRGAIMQSGSALCPGAHGRNFLKDARDIAVIFDCPESPSEDLISCLQQIPAKDLIKKNHQFDVWHKHPKYFAPRVDGIFLPDEPVNLLKEKKYNHVPMIIGTNRDEGAMESITWYVDYPKTINELLDNFEVNGPVSLELMPDDEPLNTTSKVYDRYLPGLVIGKDQADNVTQMTGHRYYQIAIDWTVELMGQEDPLYMYELHHRGQYGLMDLYLDAGLPLPQAKKWVSHSDDLQYLFDQDPRKPLEEKDDLAVREIFTNTWTNFAKTLDPTPDDSLGYKWEKIGTTGLKHFKIIPSPLMEEDYRFIDREFWNSLPLRENPYRKSDF